MSVMTLSQIEKSISLLSQEDQLLLLERIIHRLRKEVETEDSALDSQIAAMASDPEIQMELQTNERHK